MVLKSVSHEMATIWEIFMQNLSRLMSSISSVMSELDIYRENLATDVGQVQFFVPV